MDEGNIAERYAERHLPVFAPADKELFARKAALALEEFARAALVLAAELKAKPEALLRSLHAAQLFDLIGSSVAVEARYYDKVPVSPMVSLSVKTTLSSKVEACFCYREAAISPQPEAQNR